ncbi:HlyD family type I secretion periplasmic adaptor subunit [Rhizobium sp. TRM95796]|uniref:HlyD family type I secretion periplasmic adaptor subunit n=1 Tax=Rhizobium sp. TRM95796 TaxID=2979862 RepID=UPI0021E93FD0|nr:HlyD family type I secretion periplasmic adaptor subunit [Rhizobium sp. TRM95796]MCV3767531.1 HlyD family type I secretion periplasmic adaptor subunit [Rhizobium sp. TRM95796]
MSSASITIDKTEYRVLGHQPASNLSDWDDVVLEESVKKSSLRGPIVYGGLTLLIAIGGFFGWASYAEMAQASAASGKIIVEGKTKTITHLEGGTLQSLVVNDGQHVRQGDLLVRLDVTRSVAQLVRLKQDLVVQTIKLQRLLSEKDEKNDFVFSAALPAGVERTVIDQMISVEQKLFKERRDQFLNQLATDRSMVQQLQSQRVALLARKEALAKQLDFVTDDFKALEKLQKSQLATRTNANEKQYQMLDLKTRLSDNDFDLADNVQREMQAELGLSNRRMEYFKIISEQIQEAQAEIARIRQEIVSAEDVVAKAEIRSPQDGIVANIKVRTPGSAVPGGQPILDVVPDDQLMLVEGRARASDIDSLRVGAKTEIRLSAFGAAETHPLVGRITYIAPDSIVDEKTSETVYVVQAVIDKESMAKQPNLFLYPGMTADMYIVNGTRTAIAYLTGPMMRGFNKAFREQ